MRIQFVLRRSILFFVSLCSRKVVSKQPAARGFQKVISMRSIARHADVERLAFSAMKRLKNFVYRFGETEAPGQIVRRAERQNRKRNPAVHDLPRSFVHRPVPSGCNYE